MYDKCYFCLDQLPKLKKESTASFFVNFGRSRGTKEPTYITVLLFPPGSNFDKVNKRWWPRAAPGKLGSSQRESKGANS